MESYTELRKHIKRHVVPQGGDAIKELDRLRMSLDELYRQSDSLMNLCVDRGLIDPEDKSQGFLEWQDAMSDAKKLLL